MEKEKKKVRLENKNPLPRRSIQRDLNSLLPTSTPSPALSRSISMCSGLSLALSVYLSVFLLVLQMLGVLMYEI